MPAAEPFLISTRKLNELGLRHMVSGSVAAIFSGEPRLTNDVDIIVFLLDSMIQEHGLRSEWHQALALIN